MKAKLFIRRKISAAHHLPGYQGKCAKLHGHTWTIEVWITGEIEEETGMVVDFAFVKKVIDTLDHATLNDYFDMPTAENIAADLCKTLAADKVRVWESEDCYAEVCHDLQD